MSVREVLIEVKRLALMILLPLRLLLLLPEKLECFFPSKSLPCMLVFIFLLMIVL